MQMIRKVMDYIRQQHMFEPGDKVVAGISGGADSVCLLFVLQEICKQIPLEIHVVHINHLIREEAGEDEAFVKDLCERFHIPFIAVHEDVEALAAQRHITTEEAGREVRYQAFYHTLEKISADGHGKIAIAHNMNDSAETMLFHLFRGSGLKGLGGIAPVRDQIVRPLLCVERCEIEQYLKQIKQPYCTDATNLTDDYTRNRIRHHILQFATDEICQASISHVQQAAEKLSAVNGLIERLTEQAYKKCVDEYLTETEQKSDTNASYKQQKSMNNDSSSSTKGNKIVIRQLEFQTEDPVIQQQIILKALSQIAGTRKDLGSIHVEDIMDLFLKQCGRHLDLPYGIKVDRIYEGILITINTMKKQDIRKDREQKETKQNDKSAGTNPNTEEQKIFEITIDLTDMISGEQEIILPLSESQELVISSFPYVTGEIIPQKTYTKWFDYDKIKSRLSIRSRAVGDYMIINDQGQKQMLKSFFINEKIPAAERDSMMLLAEEHHILWIMGSRISSYYKVSKETRQILQIHLRGGKNNG